MGFTARSQNQSKSAAFLLSSRRRRFRSFFFLDQRTGSVHRSGAHSIARPRFPFSRTRDYFYGFGHTTARRSVGPPPRTPIRVFWPQHGWSDRLRARSLAGGTPSISGTSFPFRM